ncbi:MAG: hypothetical protein MPJ22_00025 [Pirellulales bacterium]|nr:hypothetical protein [Pirellulales bacterium]
MLGPRPEQLAAAPAPAVIWRDPDPDAARLAPHGRFIAGAPRRIVASQVIAEAMADGAGAGLSGPRDPLHTGTSMGSPSFGSLDSSGYSHWVIQSWWPHVRGSGFMVLQSTALVRSGSSWSMISPHSQQVFRLYGRRKSQQPGWKKTMDIPSPLVRVLNLSAL